MFIIIIEFNLWILLQLAHFLYQLFNSFQSLVFACSNHSVDLINLTLVPFNLRFVVVTPVFE